MYGVSPAFVISKYGTKFTVDQFCEALSDIKSYGFDSYQPEVFFKEELMNWVEGGATKVNKKAEEIGLVPTQFVAHFLLESFSSPEKLFSDWGVEELKNVVKIVDQFPECNQIMVPVAQFNFNGYEGNYSDLKNRLNEKINIFLYIIIDAGYKFVLEILPNSIVEGNDGFLQLHKKLNSDNFGLSLDTGHSWACHELVPLLPLKLKGKIFGLHLCDNNSDVNKSFAPGKGTINWKLFMKNLKLSGYKGSLDIEIICPPEDIENEYKYGKETLEKLL